MPKVKLNNAGLEYLCGLVIWELQREAIRPPELIFLARRLRDTAERRGLFRMLVTELTIELRS